MLAVAMLLVGSVAISASSTAQAAAPCRSTDMQLVLSRSESMDILNPATSLTLPTSLTAPQAAFLTADLPFDHWLIPQQWHVTRTSLPHAYQIDVQRRATGETVLSATFDRRIELAMSLVSPSARYVAYIQANNLASEVTLMDAATATMQTVRIPHDAALAAFAMHADFSPDEQCLAVSMERSGGSGPETWLIDLETGAVSDRLDGDVVGWLPGH